MKKILFLVLTILFSHQNFAQQELIGDYWNLQYMVIDGVTQNVPTPHPGDPFYKPGIEFFGTSSADYEVQAIIHSDHNSYFDSEGPIAIDENTFTVHFPSVTLGDCGSYCALESDYLGTILSGTIERTFEYEITTEGNGDKTLVITTPEGNIAVHGDQILSNDTFQTQQIQLWPNPVEDLLHINVQEAVKQLRILSLLGNEVWVVNDWQDEMLDVSFLPSGVYYLEISNDKGEKRNQKLVKQ